MGSLRVLESWEVLGLFEFMGVLRVCSGWLRGEEFKLLLLGTRVLQVFVCWDRRGSCGFLTAIRIPADSFRPMIWVLVGLMFEFSLRCTFFSVSLGLTRAIFGLPFSFTLDPRSAF